jgi:hypothetical protein
MRATKAKPIFLRRYHHQRDRREQGISNSGEVNPRLRLAALLLSERRCASRARARCNRGPRN